MPKSEASLVPLTTRVEQIIVCCAARVMLCDAGGVAQRRLTWAGADSDTDALSSEPGHPHFHPNWQPTQARTPGLCSTLQTELVAIQLALEQFHHRQEATVMLHTDSRTGLFASLWQVKAEAGRAATHHAHQSHRLQEGIRKQVVWPN
ncbi:hypothetical protein E2C01_014567 [Portunus trituberculatus]|uniref:RNase H type-1 domain-containing protein n=1 Tax=Portunus trituberculatus TaxID=210409 RepID=A0A5B7DKI7_PORTR|nr:hypothetical protein [Portunus trituberculatus]